MVGGKCNDKFGEMETTFTNLESHGSLLIFYLFKDYISVSFTAYLIDDFKKDFYLTIDSNTVEIRVKPSTIY